MNARSLKFRLVFWYVGWLTIFFVVFGVFVYESLRHHLREAQENALARRARQVAELVLRTGDDSEYLGDIVKATFASEANNRFTRITVDGAVRHVSGPPADGSFLPEEVPFAADVSDEELFEVRAMPNTKHPLYFVTVTRHSPRGRIVVEEGTSSAGVRNALRSWLVALVTGLVALTCGAAAGGFLLVQRALAPVDQVIRSAERITLHHRNERLPIMHTGDELERLSLALNNMIERLHDSFQQNQRFLADASHELRTPLTILHAELEQLADTAEETRMARAAASALDETQRLRKIVEALFALSRFDAGEAVHETVPVDLAQLIKSTAEQMQLLADDKNISLLSECQADVVVQGDRARLKQVIVNLLDNAIKYTPAGGTVCVRLRKKTGSAVLSVCDTGIGIPEHALPHLFDRFFRVDKSRSRDEGGAGLGLSIVKAICNAHGGTVRASNRASGGSEFTVELPLDRTIASLAA